jgi:peptidoglycan/LPS O-acetylase OafA/YrhL
LGISYLSIVRYLPIFLTGTAIAIFEVKRPDEFSRKINNKEFKYAGILALALILLSIPYYFKFITGQTIDNRLAYYYLPYAILFGIILYSAKRNTGIIRNILEVKILRFLGIISFSLYIFHMLILRIITKLNTPESYKIYIFFILAIIISSISYIFIEKPLSKIKIIKRMPLNMYKCANNNDI